MKKKLLSTLLTLCLILAMAPATVLAEGTEPTTGPAEVTTEAELKAAIEAGGSVVLGADIALSEKVVITAGGPVTIDLNGHTISLSEGYTAPNNGVIRVTAGANLTLKDNTGNGRVVAGEKEACTIFVEGSGSEEAPTILIVESGTYEGNGNSYGISGNGLKHCTNITINGGTISGSQYGIYHPQDGTLTITGGTITGADTGIELRSGMLTMTGGTVTGNGTSTSSDSNGKGPTTVGAGIAVAQHTTKKNINVKISGGTVSGHTAFTQVDPEGNKSSNIGLSITGGVFHATNGGENAVSSVDQTNFISGGQFTNLVMADYIAEGMAEISLTSGGNATYYVGTSEVVAAKVAEAASGDTITVHQGDVTLENVAEGVTVENKGSGAVTVNGVKVEENGSFTVPLHTQHEFSTEWSHNETQHWHACTAEGCDEKQELADHTWDAGIVTTEPTETEKGVKTFTCTICKRVRTEEIPATGSSEPIDPPYGGPSTGSGITVLQPAPAGPTVPSAPLPPQTGAQASIPVICLALAAAAIFFWLARRTQRSR